MNGNTARSQRGLAAIVVIVIAALGCVAVFSGGANFGGISYASPETASSELARNLLELERAPKVSDEFLDQAVQAVLDRASRGEVDAVAFVAELAAKQRLAEPSSSTLTDASAP